MRVLERLLRVLEVLGEQQESVGVTQLSEQLGLPASTLHRLLGVLLQHGLVVQDVGSRRYRIGPGVLRLAKSYFLQNTLVSVAQPHLAALRTRVEETVFLTSLVGEDAICVATAESPRPLQFFMRVGQRMPYHAAASARSILAFQPRAEAERLVRREARERFTEATAVSVDDILRELQQVRRHGYAVCAEEMEVGVTALSAPVRDASNAVIASVTIVAPSVRFSAASRRAEALQMLLDASASISEALGHEAPTPVGHGGNGKLEATVPAGGATPRQSTRLS